MNLIYLINLIHSKNVYNYIGILVVIRNYSNQKILDAVTVIFQLLNPDFFSVYIQIIFTRELALNFYKNDCILAFEAKIFKHT